MDKSSSLADSATVFTYDLDSQKGVMYLLASVRASGLSHDQKNELRDLVFLYINGGKDQSVRITLEQKVTAYTVAPLADKSILVEATEPAILDFGTSRPAPTFVAVPEKPVAPPPVVTSQVVPGQPSAPVAPPTATSVVSAPPAPPTPPTPVTPLVSNPAPKPVAPPSVAKLVVPPVVKPAAVASILSSTPVATSTPITPPAPVNPPEPQAQPPDLDVQKNMQRIREIKSLVNEKVGNPVNLIDVDNAVGREYMAALLEAMKKVNIGSAAPSAMVRLEESYRAVEKVLAKSPPVATAPPVTPVPPVPPAPPAPPTPVTPPVSNPAPKPVAPPSVAKLVVPVTAPVKPPPPKKVATAAPIMIPKPPPPIAPTLTPTSVVSKPVATSVTPPTVDFATPRATPVKPVAKVVLPKLKSTPAVAVPPKTEEVSTWGSGTIAPVVAEAPSLTRVASLADTDNKLHTLADLPESSALETSSVSGDPLFTKGVDEGLNQLLTEWVIFKKSGLFGTGPKGSEHPLFKKIAELPIPLLLAGRFEGATQEIKQSITDYMNGWRYEQGIIYEQGETFEHYLRRVISHILNLQKRKKSA